MRNKVRLRLGNGGLRENAYTDAQKMREEICDERENRDVVRVELLGHY
jgi:hypothetical protein